MTYHSEAGRSVHASQWHTGDNPVTLASGEIVSPQNGSYVLTEVVTGTVEVMDAATFEATFTEDGNGPDPEPDPVPETG